MIALTLLRGRPQARRAILLAAIVAMTSACALAIAGARSAGAASNVRHCSPFVVYKYNGKYGSFTYRATQVTSSARISCKMAHDLLRAAYGQGPLKIIRTTYRHNASGQEYGRPTYWVRGGWRCTNGAGGAVCWNALHRAYNAIQEPYGSLRYAVTANVR